MSSQHEKMMELAAEAQKEDGLKPLVLNLSEADRKKLRDAGVLTFLGNLTKSQYSLREMARIADMAEAWGRNQLSAGKIKGKKDAKKRWTISRAEVHRVRIHMVQKHLGRIERKKSGKKYQYKAPRTFAFDMTTKAIAEDTTLTLEQKEIFKKAMLRYKAAWDQANKERKAKIAANKAKKEAKKKK